MPDSDSPSRQSAPLFGRTWTLTLCLSLLLLQILLVGSALAQQAQSVPAAPAISAPRGAPEVHWGILSVLLAVASGTAIAAMRLTVRFEEYSGVGLFRCLYSWLYLAFMAVMSSASYFLLVNKLGTLLWTVLGNASASILSGAGGGGVSHPLIGVVGRVLPRLSRDPEPPDNSQTGGKKRNQGEERERKSRNEILRFFYNGVERSLRSRVNSRVPSLANDFDWPTILNNCSMLIHAALERHQAEELIAYIRQLPSSHDEETSRYIAMVETMRVTSFSELCSRFSGARDGGNG